MASVLFDMGVHHHTKGEQMQAWALHAQGLLVHTGARLTVEFSDEIDGTDVYRVHVEGTPQQLTAAAPLVHGLAHGCPLITQGAASDEQMGRLVLLCGAFNIDFDDNGDTFMAYAYTGVQVAALMAYTTY